MKKTLLATVVFVLTALCIFFAGHHGVRFKASASLPSDATFSFTNGGPGWTNVPVHSGTADLGWRVFGRHGVLTYTLESDGRALAGGKVTIPRFGYAHVILDAKE